MKTFPFILALVALAGFSAPAQIVTVKVDLDQDQFLPGESLPIKVRITNNSGQTLYLGADADWLNIRVQRADGISVVLKNGEVPVTGAFKLNSSEVATKRLDIAPYFVLDKTGRYSITAVVHIQEWDADVESPAKEFDVVDGAVIWSQDFGVPTVEATNRPPEVRKYILEEANYLQKQLRLYVLVSDRTGSRIFKATAIGPMVSFSQPEAQLDRSSNLHVLYQSSAHSFIYAAVAPDGAITKRDVYDMQSTRPRLRLNATGDIMVSGGVRRLSPDELPVIKTPDQVPLPSK